MKSIFKRCGVNLYKILFISTILLLEFYIHNNVYSILYTQLPRCWNLVDRAVSKTAGSLSRVGSSPTLGTAHSEKYIAFRKRLKSPARILDSRKLLAPPSFCALREKEGDLAHSSLERFSR